MNVSVEMGLLVAAVLIFCSILISKTGYRFGVPTLLMFIPRPIWHSRLPMVK